MTFTKGFALALAFAAAVALGVWIGPHITHRGSTVNDSTAASTAQPVASIDNEQPAPHARRAPSSRASAKHTTAAATTKPPTPAGATPLTVPAAAPALHERLKPLLNKGADMGVASQDFRDAEQFAAVAHAARNTEVPFMVLKHRIVEEGKSLEDAIREFKPDLNARVEARRAHAQAKSDISELDG
jgi:cytoskeletal protein RodZ